MKKIILLMSIFSGYSTYAQNNKDTAMLLVPAPGINRIDQRKSRIKTFADSINNLNKLPFPEFLLNECFDDQPGLWEGFHTPTSLRWLVLTKVTNRRALKMILNTHDERLSKKCVTENSSNPHLEIPLLHKSFKQLILKRIRELDYK